MSIFEFTIAPWRAYTDMSALLYVLLCEDEWTRCTCIITRRTGHRARVYAVHIMLSPFSNDFIFMAITRAAGDFIEDSLCPHLHVGLEHQTDVIAFLTFSSGNENASVRDWLGSMRAFQVEGAVWCVKARVATNCKLGNRWLPGKSQFLWFCELNKRLIEWNFV